MLDEKKLLRMKKEVEETKIKISELKGEEKSLMTRLKDEWGITSLQEAENVLKERGEVLTNLSLEITEKTKAIEETYLNTDDDE